MQGGCQVDNAAVNGWLGGKGYVTAVIDEAGSVGIEVLKASTSDSYATARSVTASGLWTPS